MKWKFQWFWISIKHCVCRNVISITFRVTNENSRGKHFSAPRPPKRVRFKPFPRIFIVARQQHNGLFHAECRMEKNWKGYAVDVNNLIKIIHLSGRSGWKFLRGVHIKLEKTFRRVNEGEAGHPKLTQHFGPAEVATDFGFSRHGNWNV